MNLVPAIEEMLKEIRNTEQVFQKELKSLQEGLDAL